MKTFLQDCAEKIYERHGADAGKIAVVLPGKRAGRFFKKHYSNLAGKSIWSPQIIAFDQFLEKVSGKNTLDSTSLIFELFDTYCELYPNVQEPFESFSSWGSMALRDFNEIDNYLIPPETIFRQITDIKEIEGWSLNDPDLTQEQRNFAAFWERLGKLYENFIPRLEKKNTTTTGQVKRWCAEKPNEWMGKMPYDHVWILGLNALTKAEKKIIYELEDRELATCLWDADAYYTDNPIQEAGTFFRELEKDNRQLSNKYELLKTGKREIRQIATASRIGQAKALSSILEEKTDNPENTAIVLTDESLLMPVLSSLPQGTDRVNVTMGLPLEFTSLKVVFDNHLELIEHRSKDQSGQNKIYYRHLIKCISQPGMKAVVNREDGELTEKIQNHIQQNNLIWIDPEELTSEFPLFENVIHLLERPKDTETLIAQQRLLAENLKESNDEPLHREMTFRFSLLINKLENYLSKYPFINSVNGYRKLWNQLLRQENLSFIGEPLSGLQVLGMLETRAVDFEHVVILSANEEILPQSKFDQSFIPFDLKKHYGLPTYQQRDAIFAYYFYRLLQRAKKVDLVYSTVADEMGSVEKSRFLAQIECELPAYNSEVKITNHFINTPSDTVKPESKVEKTADMLKVVDGVLDYGISPSAINLYLDCPLNFYYRYILKLREREEVEERIELSTFGTVVHDTLEELYKPYEKKVIAPEDVTSILAKANEELERQFKNSYSKNISHGENLLTFEVAREYIFRFLTKDRSQIAKVKENSIAVTIESLEIEMRPEVLLPGFEDKTVRINGKADRIDRYGDEIRIIDYKTGKVDPSDLKVTDMGSLRKKPKAIQLLCYCLAYSENYDGDLEKLRPGMISLKNIGSGFLPLIVNGSPKITTEVLDEFRAFLGELLSEIYLLEQPFVHNPDANFCEYCE
ncbi:PD-(D/E)XK nuclease family protein [Halocola ammonii]